MLEIYDVGIYGLWYGNNYGNMIAYCSLDNIVQKLGYSTVMIENPLRKEGSDISKLPKSHPRRFANGRYKLSKHMDIDHMSEANTFCKSFLIGPDQSWNYDLSRAYKQTYYLDFAADNRLKISYGTSFGKYPYNGPESEKKLIEKNLKRFETISVRDNFSKRIIEEDFHVKTEQVLDPVFLCDKEFFDDLAAESTEKEYSDYIYAYILDPNPEIGNSLKRIIEKTGKKMLVIFDAPADDDVYYSRLGVSSDKIVIMKDAGLQTWISCFKNSEYVITDSFYGVCLSVIYKKNFLALKNVKRGGARFESLTGTIGLKSRLVDFPEKIYDEFLKDEAIDYDEVEKMISVEKKKSVNRLKKSLESVKSVNMDEKIVSPEKPAGSGSVEELPPEVITLYKNSEFIKIRILATLLRDYGIKHIVLSPGGRDVPLVRMFENNSNVFKLHRVTDERSAAYYGLGIAAQTRKPVACVCTSGTAVSNYLPAVTEAYYTGVPLIMITADRFRVFHEHGEDQTIPQENVFAGVTKKAVTLPEIGGFRGEYQTRRDISECILEATHHTFGPVHINIAIGDISMGSTVGKEYWNLLPKIYPHILYVNMNDEKAKMMQWVDQLKGLKRILLVYGQNPPADDRQKKNIEAFASKYNCVVVTDHISNLDVKYCIKPHIMLQSITQEEFNEKLSPSVIISVGGKRLMNDPLTFKIRGGLKNIRHWSVAPDGKLKDFYFRLTSVLEMSQDKFFEFFSENAGDIKNNEEYYKTWETLSAAYPSPVIKDFNSNYVQSQFLPRIPKNSMLHLGVGQSFYECRKYHIDSSVEVFCNMGTNGIDGCTSTFLGQCSVIDDRLCFLLVGDLSFFYDMNSIWNKPLKGNIRILLVNNNGTALLRRHKLKGISSVHNTAAKGWVESTGFKYISASSKEELEKQLPVFLGEESDKAIFLEVFCK